MPRPTKCKNVCKMPISNTFVSQNNNSETTTLTVEEYEVIRLMDNENFSQEQCAKWMNVSRATIQILYTNARKKIANFLTKGGKLIIDGGNYKICDCNSEECNCTNCNCHKK